MNHTPTPYRYEIESPTTIRIVSDDYGTIAVLHNPLAEELGLVKEHEATGAFIVRACNAHDDLVEALEMLMQTCQEEGHLIRLASYRQAESALKLARGE